LFYNPDLMGNNYVILHSNARGELYQENWKVILHRRNTPLYNHDQTDVDEYYGMDPELKSLQIKK